MKKNILKATPIITISLLIIGWIIMLFLNYYLNKNNHFTGSRITFPISVVYFSEFSLQGILFSFLFLIIGLFILNKYEKFNYWQLFFSYIILILLGNLSQSSIHYAFLRSFIDTDFQYYHDAIKVKDGYSFITSYNKIQDSLTMHAKTHPPFAVWIQYVLLRLTNYSVLGLSLCMSFIGLLSFIPLYKILNLFNIEKSKQNLLILIFSLIPAINIYTIVSIDALFLLFSLTFLYGLILIIKSNNLNYIGIITAFIGFTLASSISFSSSFLAFVAFIVCLFEFTRHKNYYPLFNFIIIGCLFLLILLIYYFLLNYNHIEAFLAASKSENPRGFRGFYQPLVYFFTRIEDISEILLFLSFSFFAYLFTPKVFNLKKGDINFYLPIIAFSSLIIMFLTGAYGTGETARACLYIYPYFLLLLINIKNKYILLNIAYIALTQTFIMQMIGDYFW